jgi:hypothetical protein
MPSDKSITITLSGFGSDVDGNYNVPINQANGGVTTVAFNYPNLDEAQSSLISAVEALTSGTATTKQEVKDIYTIIGYALSRIVGDPSVAVAATMISHSDMIKLLEKWKITGNVNASVAHPLDANLSLAIDWKQLVTMLLPIFLQAIQKGIKG